tara:strand:- start:371 stop:547 length:177 start_codon:yes stop_codon:yes gene_type:complete
MPYNHHLSVIIRDIMKKNNDKPDVNGQKKDKKNELSPKTIKRNKSNDNFMKFQWPWLI